MQQIFENYINCIGNKVGLKTCCSQLTFFNIQGLPGRRGAQGPQGERGTDVNNATPFPFTVSI